VYIATYIKTAITEEKLIHSTQFQFFLQFCDLPNKSLDEAKYVTVRQHTTSTSEKQG
jgi:hypothetical protein